MKRAKDVVLPAYLFLCLMLGGSIQNVWGNALLQLLAIAILAWSAMTRKPQVRTPAGRSLLMIVGAVALLFVLQLIPLPPAAWTALPSREFLESGYMLLGLPPPWLPLSLAPYDTITTSLTLLPPVALLVGMLRLRYWTATGMLVAIAAAAAVSIALGVLQVTGSEASWYLYEVTNIGVAVGAFANGNHFATLLLIAIPMVGALAAMRWRSVKTRQERSLTAALAIAAAALLAIGLLVNGSTAVLLLGPPVAAATVMLVMRLPPQRVRLGLAAIGLFLGIAAAVFVVIGKDLPNWGTQASIETRMEFWSKTVRATQDHVLTGSGFGTFQQVYRRLEDPGAVDRWYANHAHNDYLEIALEGGILAVVLIGLFLAWWTRRARDAWLSPAATVEQKAAAVASAAILVHSAFDYPLRTAAIMAVMAVCMALLAGAAGKVRATGTEPGRRARHATL